MEICNKKYSDYALVKEMVETVDLVRKFDVSLTREISGIINKCGKLLLTGEGSSRIFPAKNAIRKALTEGVGLSVFTDGSRQSLQYDLSEFCLFCASNSGRTKEVILLADKMSKSGNENCFALTANSNTPLEKVCKKTFVLKCGMENAVAATKSVVEQALFYESLLWNITGKNSADVLDGLPDKMEEALSMKIPDDIIEAVVSAPTIYFAGYNDGVAEELTLKTNEITRKKSDYLEGTYAVHGIEEVMQKEDIVFVVDPVDDEIKKFREVLVDGVGLKVVAIAERETGFPTILVPDAGKMNPYIYLCAGWNILVETGIMAGIDLDKPERARKVGNELEC